MPKNLYPEVSSDIISNNRNRDTARDVLVATEGTTPSDVKKFNTRYSGDAKPSYRIAIQYIVTYLKYKQLIVKNLITIEKKKTLENTKFTDLLLLDAGIDKSLSGIYTMLNQDEEVYDNRLTADINSLNYANEAKRTVDLLLKKNNI